ARHAGRRTKSAPLSGRARRFPSALPSCSSPGGFLPAVQVEVLPVFFQAIARTDAVDRRRPGDLAGALSVEHHQRLLARLVLANGIHQEATVEHDSLVGAAEVLPGAVLDAALRLAGPLVVDVDVEAHAGEGRLLLFLDAEAPAVRSAEDRLVVRRGIGPQALRAHRVLVDRGAEAREDRIPVAAVVVDRHVPL